MGFFDDVLHGPEPPEEEEYESPEWLDAPSGWLGGVVPLELLVGKSDKAAVVVSRLGAFPTGFSLVVEALVRGPLDIDAAELHHGPSPFAGPVPDTVLRFGIEYPDGRKASSVGGSFASGSDHIYAIDDTGPSPDPSRDLHLFEHGGGGGETDSHQEYWVWPLPPAVSGGVRVRVAPSRHRRKPCRD